MKIELTPEEARNLNFLTSQILDAVKDSEERTRIQIDFQNMDEVNLNVNTSSAALLLGVAILLYQ